MENYPLVFALIVTFICAVFGASTEEDCFHANSERFSRIEETLKKIETENRHLHNVVEKQQIKISKFERMIVEQERMGKDGNKYKNRSSRLLEGGSQSTPGIEQVAFYAYMSKTEAISPHHTLIFDQVETNVGQAYNNHSGAFTVPISGVYIFSYTVFPNGVGSYASVELTVNSMSHGAIFVDSSSADGDYTGCTGFAVLVLKQGDVCLVRLHSTYKSAGHIESDSIMRSSFSGVKV